MTEQTIDLHATLGEHVMQLNLPINLESCLKMVELMASGWTLQSRQGKASRQEMNETYTNLLASCAREIA